MTPCARIDKPSLDGFGVLKIDSGTTRCPHWTELSVIRLSSTSVGVPFSSSVGVELDRCLAPARVKRSRSSLEISSLFAFTHACSSPVAAIDTSIATAASISLVGSSPSSLRSASPSILSAPQNEQHLDPSPSVVNRSHASHGATRARHRGQLSATSVPHADALSHSAASRPPSLVSLNSGHRDTLARSPAAPAPARAHRPSSTRHRSHHFLSRTSIQSIVRARDRARRVVVIPSHARASRVSRHRLTPRPR